MTGGLDRALFLWLNGTVHWPFLDQAMPVITNVRSWGPLLVAGWLYLVLFRGRRGRVAALTLAAAIALADLTAAQVLKPLVARPRPCHAMPAETRLLVRCGGRNGFPSNHAANVTTAATVLGIYFPPSLWVTVPAAALVSWSRVYVGVHYPGDVAAGALLGLLVGGGVSVAARRRFLPGLPPG